MDGITIVQALNADLDVLARQAMLQGLYTQISSCFPVSNESLYPSIIDTLTQGLERLSVTFPYVAGQVVKQDADTFRIVPLEKVPRLVVKDLRNDTSIPTMDALREARFPMSMLDENVVAPRNTIPSGSHPHAPVFLLQATFIIGGLILTFVGQHNVMDMTGQGQLISLLSKACHNEKFTSDEVASGHLSREDLVPLLDDSYRAGDELARYIAKPTPPAPAPVSKDNSEVPPPPPKCSWATFIFEPTSLGALKSLAAKSITQGFVSTDDTLTAFIWQAIGRARLPRFDANTKSTLARAVDVRRHLGISPMYHGLMQNMTYVTHTFGELVSEPLGVPASELRQAVDPKTSNLGHLTRALTTHFARSSPSDQGKISITATIDLSSDITLSSWSKINMYELDFNLGLGKPEAVRRPLFVPVESLIYLMPKKLDGEIAVTLCLRDEDMDRLKVDEEFNKYGIYVG